MAKTYGFGPKKNDPNAVLTDEEAMKVWRKLQMKYTAEIEALKQRQMIEMELMGFVSEETQKNVAALMQRILENEKVQ